MALREILKTRSPSVIVSFLTNVNVATIAVSIALSSPVVVAERSHPPQMKIGWKLALLRRLTYPFAARVVMLTSLGLKWLETNVFAAHGIVVSNPIIFPMKSVAPTHKPADYFDNNRKVLLAVGRLAPEKQIHHLIRAFSILAKQNHDWDLAIVGAGPLLASLQNLVLTLELDERVKFIGRAGNIGDWYERADIYVLCSQFEGFPNTLAEAMAYGCAVVSYDCDTGPRDIVTSGVDGILVPPNNEEILANEIARLMADKATRERLAQAAEAVRVRFGLPRILDNWDAVFADLQVALT